MAFPEAPITLQRNCKLRFDVRDGGRQTAASSASFEVAVDAARLALKAHATRVQVIGVMTYDPTGANEQARAQIATAGGEMIISVWEIFPADVIRAPVGAHGLPPDYFEAALALQEDDPREVVDA